MTRILDRTAPTDAPILDVLAERWSTRLFDASAALDEDALASALEAARWAPSANNSQPVRFIVAPNLPDDVHTITLSYTFFKNDALTTQLAAPTGSAVATRAAP